jgi:hypothetical protein
VRRALRRLGSLLLTLFVTSLCALWALSALERGEPAARALPNFFNPAPRSARSLSEAALAALAKHDDRTAALELSRLGGAALPHLLPRFEQLPKLTRERVASALVPVAVRMGIAAPGEAVGVYTVVEAYNSIDRYRRLGNDLARRGWSQSRLEKFFGANFLRVYRDAWGG